MLQAGIDVLRSLLNSEYPSNKVLESKSINFASRQIHMREDGLVLYLPQKDADRNVKPTYEIVLHRPTTETLVQTFSLYRAFDLEEAETKFVTLHDKLPVFIEIAKELCNIYGLQKICDMLTDHPSWTLAHLAAYFAIYESFSNPSINSFLNSSDGEKGMSPLQVAITTHNLKTVQILVAANCSLEHLLLGNLQLLNNDHPSWTLAHLAAYFAIYESFSNPSINSFLNSSDGEKGMSPLQVAITTHNLKTVQILVAANCSLEHLDNDNNSVFHYAASTSKDIIGALTQGSPPKCLNSRNKNGYTPLHMACLSDKPDCVNALLLAGADVNKNATDDGDYTEPGYVGNFLQDNPNTLHKKDMKHGGTPLHWANSRAVIEALIDVNCDINALNFELQTALHVMVERQRLDCVVALLSRQAKTDLPDKAGNRPIHSAAKSGNLPILQALIVFGADLNIMNNKGQLPRHLIPKDMEPKVLYHLHVVGAQRCSSDMNGCSDGCSYNGTYNGIPPPKVIGPTNREILNQMLAVAGMEVASRKHKKVDFPKKGRLLCLDGGGIRGLVLVQMLLELESVFQRPISFCFDWLAGTSTGGILALAIASGKTMKECQCLYFRLKEKTFIGSRPYCSENLENVMKETFGSETVMSDIKHPKVMVTGVLADRKPAELHLFRNYTSPNNILRVKHDSPYELPPPPEQQFVWQVGRATGAAPTYYRMFQRYLDGGLIANNPTLDALTEIHEHSLALHAMGRDDEACPVSVVVSLGTGVIPVTALKLVDVFRPETIWDTTKILTGISNLGTLLVDQATASDGRVVDRARAWCSSLGIPYFRYSPQMSEEVAMDERSDEKLCNMLWETKAYMHENVNLMRELADVLSRG